MEPKFKLPLKNMVVTYFEEQGELSSLAVTIDY